MVKALKSYIKWRNKNAEAISFFMDGVLNAKDESNKLKLTLKLKRLFNLFCKDKNSRLNCSFNDWRKIVYSLQANERALLIQKYH